MAGSSPPHPGRHSHQWASPGQRSTAAEFLYEDRNSEAKHKSILENARREHERVRRNAEEVYQQYLLNEEQRRLEEEQLREEKRIQAEERLAAERRRVAELKAKKVEIPPEPKPEPPRAAPPQPKATLPTSTTPAPKPNPFGNAAGSTTPAQPNGTSTPKTEPPRPAAQVPASSAPSPAPANPTQAGPFGGAAQPAKPNPFGATAASPKPNPFAAAASSPKPNPFAPSSQASKPADAPKPSPAAAASSPFGAAARSPFGTAPGSGLVNGNTPSQPAQASAPRSPATPDRYQIIHKNLKELRKSLLNQAKMNPALKSRLGDMRREVRKCVGQLVHGVPGAGQNRTQIASVKALLREALGNAVQSQLIDPTALGLEPREPVEGATHNDPQLPSLFLYVLNIFGKAVISQFINEAAAKPETADPVGVVAAAVFADREFLWRGKTLIDILLAKFRVVCPVVFGHFGSEKYEEGRRNLGWHRDGDQWVSEQQHTDRMTGLGAGFASIALRNFGKSKAMSNPYPPSNYWTAMARIVNTPPAEISNTQAVVLKAMIQNNEPRFLDAYGNAGLAALRLALIEFPGKAPVKSAAINSLEVHARLLEKTTGLRLA